MNREESLVPQQLFARWVRDALKHLYDSPHLENHPLVPLLLGDEPARPPSASQSLRQVMLDAIQALRPGPGVPAQSPDWRAFRILELRYLEGLTRAEIMAELGVAKSQFFRDLAQILDLLAQHLWEQYLASAAGPRQAGDQPSVQTETGRLAASARWEALDLAQVASDLQPILQPLTRSHGIRLDCQAAQPAPCIRADRVVLRQALINLILYLVSLSQPGRIDMACTVEQEHVALRVRARVRHASPATGAQHQRLDLCRQLMAAMAGQLELTPEGPWLVATLRWPRARPRVLLIIDDNEGLIDLYRRYLAGQSWQVIGARSGRDAWQAVAEARPAAILLDVMMPEEDGWEILVSLKRAPATCDIPVIICSVVNEPELARSLGAAANLPKPVTQKALLELLSRWG